ncbi:MAG: GNAT family N-acetyltransferase [Candidatus Sericytochromatia bacterium]
MSTNEHAIRKRQAPMLLISPATEADMGIAIDAVRSSADWYESLVDEQDLGEHHVDKAWARRNFQEREFFVGRTEKNEPVGILSLQDTGEYLYIGYLYLFTGHVGQGFGKRFLQYAEQEAWERGKKGLVLICHPEADWACKAYEKYGFACRATEKEAVLAWNDGWLVPYYEEGFVLYAYELEP